MVSHTYLVFFSSLQHDSLKGYSRTIKIGNFFDTVLKLEAIFIFIEDCVIDVKVLLMTCSVYKSTGLKY